ncbi:MAG: ThuA domain-containing protein [Reichenbachiella sp.]
MGQIFKLCSFLLVVCLLISCASKEEKVLVFSKTAGYRHGSIETGIAAIKKIGEEKGYKITHTENARYFVEDSLKQYGAVIFLNTTGNLLNIPQQSEFERYIQAGGGYIGIHAATDAEYDWPWYNKLAGAYFAGHPSIQNATLNVHDKTHASTSFMNNTEEFKDEWYNFKNINPAINVLLEIDESSYEGGENGEHHPMAWFHEYDGGRAFYTGMGHTNESFEDARMLDHLTGGIEYAIGNNTLNYALAKTLKIEDIPQENRFVRTILDFNLNEPMEIDELPGKGILFVERRGALRLYDFAEGRTKTLAQVELFYGNEDGLLGIAVDPNYTENNWIYLFYSQAEEHNQRVSRFDLVDEKLILESEKTLLEFAAIRSCCHSGGALEFGPDGNLFVFNGDNTNPFASDGYAPIDERKGRESWDSQKSAGNANDLRGAILRIKPENDGTYSIPKGNLFPEGTTGTKPEIYVMGVRNPFRGSIDRETGYLYWGDVGPDAGKDHPTRGPKGMGEFNLAKKAGYYGWPYSRGDNQMYFDYDFTTEKSGEKFDPNHIVNNSPNNTGIQELPPIQESMIWYGYGKSDEFPWLGKGGVNPMAGPVFHKSQFESGTKTFPSYFEDKLFIYEWMRDWIYIINLDENHNYKSAERFMPNSEFNHPMDMLFGSDGNMYLLEYGRSWNTQNLDARLNKISFKSGNREPVAKINIDKKIGSAPLTVNFSGTESFDFDNDKLSYSWKFLDDNTASSGAETSHTFKKEGAYTVTLTVKDKSGAIATAETTILVGNDPPVVSIELNGDTNYWDNKKLDYKVIVNDNQDGTTTNGSIAAEDVQVTFNYIPQGEDIILATVGHQKNTVPKGRQIIDGLDCKVCHATDLRIAGPSYMEIAGKYDKKDIGKLAAKIIKGGSGVWGENPMSAHPELSLEDAKTIMSYILTLSDKKTPIKSLPLQGSINFTEHIEKEVAGKYILMASYRDKGDEGQPNSSISTREQIIFTPPTYSYIASNENVDDDITGTIEVIKSDATYKVVIIPDGGTATNLTDVKVSKNVVTGAMVAEGTKIEMSLKIENDTIVGTAILPDGIEFKIYAKRKNN